MLNKRLKLNKTIFNANTIKMNGNNGMRGRKTMKKIIYITMALAFDVGAMDSASTPVEEMLQRKEVFYQVEPLKDLTEEEQNLAAEFSSDEGNRLQREVLEIELGNMKLRKKSS